MNEIDAPYIKEFDKIGTPNLGYISVAEVGDQVPFAIKRVYWTYFTPNHVQRGQHAHRQLRQFIFSVAGIIHFQLENQAGEQFEFTLDEPHQGLYIPAGYWRSMRFSHNAVLLCLASMTYDEADYIRDYDTFKKWSQ